MGNAIDCGEEQIFPGMDFLESASFFREGHKRCKYTIQQYYSPKS